MKTLVTAIQKGGQGKTFATCHLAFDFLERGLRVAELQTDVRCGVAQANVVAAEALAKSVVSKAETSK